MTATQTQNDFMEQYEISNKILDLIVWKEIFKDFWCTMRVIYNEKDWYVVLYNNSKKGLDFIWLSLIFWKNKKKLILDWIYLPTEYQWQWLWKKYLQWLVQALKTLSIPKITGDMARRDKHKEIWYYTWPRLGFTWLQWSKKLHKICMVWAERYSDPTIQKKFIACNNITDLMNFQEWRDIWKELGFTFKWTLSITQTHSHPHHSKAKTQ